ncbi:hypothetical protein LshimejAT787_1900960 [Lyophyllum shimeji]|uniref:Uncharacterized protein n=1 Tax=Lyophyllum shimeji TaxID=47721 RepID=A0A9P3Q0R8_LYOSH|nr:hypothetical protein LshimejAT787_1900960 [Lyophyllum shimeji]
MWSACLYSNGNNSLPLYKSWGTECQKHSQDLKDGYPKQWADKVAIPDWARIAVPGNSTFDIDTALRSERLPAEIALETKFAVVARTPNPWGLPQIIVPIAAVLATLVLGSAIFAFYRFRSGEKGFSWTLIPVWLCPRKPRVVRQASRSNTWSIDRNDSMDDYVMVNPEDEPRTSHVRFPSTEDVKFNDSPDAEYQLPLQTIWKKSQIAQQIRRLPDQIPLPWKGRPIHITSQPPGKRFRVDSLNTSTESGGADDPTFRTGTVEGDAGRPDTIVEAEEYPATSERNSMYEDEGTSLISHSERDSNRVFLISHRSGDFTLESGSSNQNSGTSHQVKVVPPTPTDSSRLSRNHGAECPSAQGPLSRHPELPPAPKQPAPLPPGQGPPASSPIQWTIEQVPQQAGPSNRDTPQPHAPEVVSTESLLLTPRSLRHDLSPAPQLDDNDPLKRSHSPIRPMGARLLSSPRHIARQLSLEDGLSQNLSPSGQSMDSMYTFGSPSRTPRPPTPSSRNPTFSSDDVSSNFEGSLVTPRLQQHSRRPSMESLIPARGDPVMLFPGPVRGAGYTIGLSSDASESSASLYSTTSSGNLRSPPGVA